MALPSIVQQAGSASSSAAPATFTQNFAASQAGTCLIAWWAGATSGAPNESFPAGWLPRTAVILGTTLFVQFVMYPNNPGGITSLAVTGITNCNAVAIQMYEVAGISQATFANDRASVQQGSNASSTAVGVPAPGTIGIAGNEFQIGAVVCLVGSTYTQANITGTLPWVNDTTLTSTLGATNLQLFPSRLLQGANPSPQAAIAGSLGANGAWAALMVGFFSTSSGQLSYAGASELVTAGQGYAVGI